MEQKGKDSSTKMIIRLSLGILILTALILGLFGYYKTIRVEYSPTEYEEKLIEYFKEIALETEYFDNSHKTVKWKKKMILFISKDHEDERIMKVIQNTVQEINDLATDGFKIELDTDPSKCNSILYLHKRERIAKIAPDFYKIFSENTMGEKTGGFAYSHYQEDSYKIVRSDIFVDVEEPIEILESLIVEELTHSIGLYNNSKKHSNSVFYENKGQHSIFSKEYSQMDADIVRLLYHPKMRPGLNSDQVENVIKRILKSEAKKK